MTPIATSKKATVFHLMKGKSCNKQFLLIPETAGLLPAKYLQKSRRGRSKWDVRQNLFEHEKEIKKKDGKKSKKAKYCNRPPARIFI